MSAVPSSGEDFRRAGSPRTQGSRGSAVVGSGGGTTASPSPSPRRPPELGNEVVPVSGSTPMKAWRRDYNEIRRHSSLGDLPLAAFAAQIQRVAPDLC